MTAKTRRPKGDGSEDFRFKRPSVATAKKTAEKRVAEAKKGSGGDFEQLPSSGSHRYRVLGPWSAEAARENQFYAIRRKHFGIPAYGEGGRTFARCLRDRDGMGECPICDEVDENRDEGEDNKLWKQESVPDFLFNVIRRNSEGEDTQHVLSAMGYRGSALAEFLEKDIVRALEEEDLWILDLRKGCDIRITATKEGKKLRMEYNLAASAKGPTPALKGVKPEDIKFVNLSTFERVTDEDREGARLAARALRKMVRQRAAARADDVPDEEDEYGEEDAPKDPDPKGWRVSVKTGKPRAPKISTRTQKPLCMGNWDDPLRKNDPDRQRPKNAQCKICPSEAECREEADG